ncbi:hypothetical protein [Sphingobium aromaticiconvertens]|uniref:hypothetical protein n=1 Tax=Sphingobium aromaticiconvertens TaxID=365341 RepID=UPI003015D870
MSRVLPLDDVIQCVRFELYQAVAVDGLVNIEPLYIADAIGSGVTASFVSLAARQLEELKELEINNKFIDTINVFGKKPSLTLLPYGARRIEQDLKDDNSRLSKYRDFGVQSLADGFVEAKLIPASDRVVSLDDNDPKLKEIVSEARDLSKRIADSNDIGDMSDEDRKIAILEVDQLAHILEQPVVRISNIVQRAIGTLTWIGEQAAGAVVGAAALALLALIATYFGFIF